MIYSFLGKNSYAAGDYYDVAALGFLQAVQRYLTQPWLRRYAFSTIAWQTMARGVAAERKAGERRRLAEQRYIGTVQPFGLGVELEERLLLHDLMAGTSEEQHRLALLRLQGSTMTEAARLQGMGVKRARTLLRELRQDYLLLNTETERGLNIHEY